MSIDSIGEGIDDGIWVVFSPGGAFENEGD